ncbi:hypothetical protein [Caloranaerobacter ferrireducens]|uniref:hypothetical protein n=1 Tax=Caloranaerobacter ferrireducens TaxID=1323370 RepID=UPI00084CF9A2|nr:hypothetical protein [Caloranaerobacter ferrireducens]
MLIVLIILIIFLLNIAILSRVNLLQENQEKGFIISSEIMGKLLRLKKIGVFTSYEFKDFVDKAVKQTENSNYEADKKILEVLKNIGLLSSNEYEQKLKLLDDIYKVN